jgi:hypothetical protein
VKYKEKKKEETERKTENVIQKEKQEIERK